VFKAEGEATMAAIESADASGEWGVVTNTENQYYINASLKVSNSTLTSTKEMIQIGKDGYEKGIYTDSTGTIQLGSLDSSGYGKDGSFLQIWTKYVRDNITIKNFKLYGSVIWKNAGTSTSPNFSGTVDVRDSSIGGDYWYFQSAITSGNFFRSVYACTKYFYCYTGNLSISDVYLIADCSGVLLGLGNSRIDNITFASTQDIRRYSGCNVTAVNCSFGNTDWSTESGAFKLNNSPSGSEDLHVYIKYAFDLTVINEAGDPISGANVQLIDGQGNTVVSTTTNASGEITQQECLVWDAYIDYSDSWGRKNIDYRNYILKIYADGFETYRKPWSFTEKVDWRIKLRHSSTPGRDEMGSKIR
jgi:hypothetical protein